VLTKILGANEQAVCKVTPNGLSVALLALSSNLSMEAKIEFIKAYNACNPYEDDNNWILFKQAVEHDIWRVALDVMLRTDRTVTAKRDCKERTLLDACIEEKLSDEATLVVLKISCEETKVWDRFGRLPLHSAILNNLSDMVVLAILRHNNDACLASVNGDGRCPIQLAIKNKASDTIVLALLGAQQTVASLYDQYGCLAFHCAMDQSYSDEVVLAILYAYIDAAKVPDTAGRLPLLLALEQGRAVCPILRANEEAASLPRVLELAVKMKHDVVTVDAILGICSDESVCNKNAHGKTPLILALELNADDSIILNIIKKCPQAVGVDWHGSYPLHFALRHTHSEDVVLAMITCVPCKFPEDVAPLDMLKTIPWFVMDAVSNRDPVTGEFPFNLAAKNGFAEIVLCKLIELYPCAVSFETALVYAVPPELDRLRKSLVFEELPLQFDQELWHDSTVEMSMQQQKNLYIMIAREVRRRLYPAPPKLTMIAVGEAWAPMLDHDENHLSWSTKMKFWAYDGEMPGTIRVAVGEASNTHRFLINHNSKTQDEWSEGASMTFKGWEEKMELWVDTPVAKR
jgi:hypothetical protein